MLRWRALEAVGDWNRLPDGTLRLVLTVSKARVLIFFFFQQLSRVKNYSKEFIRVY